MKPFGKYSEYYDLIYQDKDYEGECDFIEEAFRNFSSKPIKTILDAGCGTGGHSIPLVKRGYSVTGIDVSEVAVKIAKKKRKQSNSRSTRLFEVNFYAMDIRLFQLNRTFDACICMFAVMNYLTGNEDIQSALRNIREHLEKDSLFIFDCWNGLAVLRILPSVTVKTVIGEDKKVIRIARPELDALRHLCRVNYHLIVTRDNAIVDEIEETHVVRFLFPQEIAHYLEDANFELLKICPFLNLEGKVDENVWNIAIIARARK